MVPDNSTRRDALRLSGAALAGLAGLAGCSALGSGGPTPASDPDGKTPTATERRYSHSLDAPESRTVRNPTGDPAVRSAAHSPGRDHTSSGKLESSPGWDHEYWFVTAPDERDALEFSPGTTGVEAAREFVADTDLSAETLLVQQYRIGECETVQLDRFEWEQVERRPEGTFDVHADYSDTRDENCERDSDHDSGHDTEHSARKHSHAILSRIPVDVKNVDSFRYGW